MTRVHACVEKFATDSTGDDYGLANDVPYLTFCNFSISKGLIRLAPQLQKELIKNLQKQVKEWEDWKSSSQDRHAKGREKTKNPTKPNKQKVGFMKKHKPKK